MTTFSKQHYRIISEAIRISRATEQPSLIPAVTLIRLLCFHFSLDNSRFNEAVFRKACGEDMPVDNTIPRPSIGWSKSK